MCVFRDEGIVNSKFYTICDPELKAKQSLICYVSVLSFAEYNFLFVLTKESEFQQLSGLRYS